MERGHPVRLSAKREQTLDDGPRLSVLRTLADRMSAIRLLHCTGLSAAVAGAPP
jgi:hypothetical protein